MLYRYFSAASTYAHSVDFVIILIAVIVGFWLIVAEFVFFGFLFKYRASNGQPTRYITGEEKELKKWISIPHMLVIVCDIAILASAIYVWYEVKQVMPPAEHTVRIYGQQWAWTFQDPGPDGVFDTADDIRTTGELHVLVDSTYHYELMARDVVHSFAVPSFRLKQDAVPGRTIMGWFKATRAGAYDIQCTQMCGLGHALMAGRIIVETPQEHAAWLLRQENPSAPASAPAVAQADRVTVAEVRR